MKSNPLNWKLEPAPEFGAAGSLPAAATNSLGCRFLCDLHRVLNRLVNPPAAGLGVPVVEDAEQVPAPARRRHSLPSFAGLWIVCEPNLQDLRKLPPCSHCAYQ